MTAYTTKNDALANIREAPCQMPLEVMKRVIGVLPDGIGVIDPYSVSGTTLVACKELGIPFIGYEIVPEYAEIARARLADSESKEVDAGKVPEEDLRGIEGGAEASISQRDSLVGITGRFL